MSEFDRVTRFAQASDGTQLAWHEHRSPESRPKDARTVLLTNGIFTTENFWRHLVHALTARYRVVHWDYRGHGRSGLGVSGDYRQEVLSDDLRAVVEASRGPDGKPPLHVAFSMGVAVVLGLLRRDRARVPAMALIAGSPDGPFTHTLLRAPWARAAVSGVMDRLDAQAWRARALLPPLLRSRLNYPLGTALGILRKHAPREDIETLLEAMARMDPRAYLRILKDYLAQHEVELSAAAGVPALILAAEHDVLMPRRQVDALRRAIPHARYALIRDAGHATLVEAGPSVVEEVGRFLDEVG